MKKYVHLIFLLVLILLSVYIYQNYVFYKIPYNPIAEYSVENLSSFYITKNLSNGEGITIKSNDLDTCNKILKYFRELKLIPLKNKTASNENFTEEDSIFFTGMLTFGQSDKVYISDLMLDNLTILYISSSISDFHDGYYKIIDSKFDYNYIFDLIAQAE